MNEKSTKTIGTRVVWGKNRINPGTIISTGISSDDTLMVLVEHDNCIDRWYEARDLIVITE